MPETEHVLLRNGADAITSTPQTCAALIEDEVDNDVQAVKAAGTRPL